MTKRQYMTKVDGKIKIGEKHQAKIPDLIYRYNIPNVPNHSTKTKPLPKDNLQKNTDVENKNIIKDEHYANSIINYVVGETSENNIHTKKINVNNNKKNNNDNDNKNKKKNKENNNMKVKVKKKIKKKETKNRDIQI